MPGAHTFRARLAPRSRPPRSARSGARLRFRRFLGSRAGTRLFQGRGRAAAARRSRLRAHASKRRGPVRGQGCGRAHSVADRACRGFGSGGSAWLGWIGIIDPAEILNEPNRSAAFRPVSDTGGACGGGPGRPRQARPRPPARQPQQEKRGAGDDGPELSRISRRAAHRAIGRGGRARVQGVRPGKIREFPGQFSISWRSAVRTRCVTLVTSCEPDVRCG